MFPLPKMDCSTRCWVQDCLFWLRSRFQPVDSHVIHGLSILCSNDDLIQLKLELDRNSGKRVLSLIPGGKVLFRKHSILYAEWFLAAVAGPLQK